MIVLLYFFLSLTVIFIVKNIASKLDIVDHPGELKIHVKAVPYLGGIAVFLSILGGRFVLKIHIPASYWLFTSLILLLGFWDDIREVNPKYRFYIETLIATLLIFTGIKIPTNVFVSIIITWIFFMGTINSVNWMDGMDGLLTGISIIVSAGLYCIAIKMVHSWLPQFLIVFIITLVAFLVFNFHPARIFLGDAGSYLIGFTFFYMSMELLKFAFSWKLFLSILGLLSVFIVDSTIAVIRRIRNGLHPFYGDRSHIYDQIYKGTGNYLGTVFLMYLLAGLGVVVGLITYILPDRYWLVFWVSSAIGAYTILFKLKFVSITIMSDKLETHGEKS